MVFAQRIGVNWLIYEAKCECLTPSVIAINALFYFLEFISEVVFHDGLDFVLNFPSVATSAKHSNYLPTSNLQQKQVHEKIRVEVNFLPSTKLVNIQQRTIKCLANISEMPNTIPKNLDLIRKLAQRLIKQGSLG